jgi:low temperature requirement protein LtrA
MSTAAAPSVPRPPAAPVEPDDQRVTALELFFDLVFVFAITQVTGFLSVNTTGTGLLQALAIIAVLWWAWSCYAWLGNAAASDEGPFRVTILAAMGAMLIVSLAVPGAFGDEALTFGLAYLAVRALHLVAYMVLSRGDPELRGAIGRLAIGMLPAMTLIALAGALDGTARTLCWIAAIAIDLTGLAAFGVKGWRVRPAHFAERHGLIVIIALGESIVAIGAGVGHHAIDAGVIAAALFGFAVAAAVWWLYFDIVVLVADRRFGRARGDEQVKIARDSYTYLHLPMVAGIILFALGVKKTLAHVGDPLDDVPAVAMCGGVALYLLAHVAFRFRIIHRLNYARAVTAVLLLAAIPLATVLPSLVSLGLVALAGWALIAYERVRYAELRDRLRHQRA